MSANFLISLSNNLVNNLIFFSFQLVQEPSREKLLPDPLTYPYLQPPFTLVLEIADVLVHPDWTVSRSSARP